jgi:hypothetical protein
VSRLERKVELAMQGYEALPEDFRQRFEAALVAAKDALEVAEGIPQHLRDTWMETAVMIFSEGKIAGSWKKVHQALASKAPRLYTYVEKLIPRDSGIPGL